MLEISNLTKIYDGKVLALDKVTFEVQKGEFLAVIGLSGSGKSTLGKAILNVLKLTAPDVRVKGEILLHNNNIYTDLLKLNRKDINCILIGGSIISLFNIINIEKINTQLKLPVISLTFNEARSLKAIFDKKVSNLTYKKEQYLQIKNRQKIKLKTLK